MASVNKVILVGNLGHDPQIRDTQNGECVANMSLATSEKWTDKQGQKQEKTEWHNLTAFGRTAELCRDYLKKGSQIYCEGKLQTDEWTDKDGAKRKTTKVIISVVQFLDRKEKTEATSQAPAQTQTDFSDIPM